MKKIINYSGIPALVLIAALVFMPFSCNKDTVKDNPLPDKSSQLIKVSGEDAGEITKTTLNGLITSWVITTDKVGIYSADARTATSGGTAIVNAQFTAASTGTSSLFNGAAPMYWGTGTATSHTFYAYYPYTEGTAASTVVPVSLATNQTQLIANSSAHLGALDFMIATPKTVTSPGSTAVIENTQVSLRYNHVFTVLEFQIKGTGTLNAVRLTALSNPIAFSGGTIDITLATPATGISYTIGGTLVTSNQVVVTLGSAPTLSTTTATTVYMVINPGTQTGNCLIGLKIGDTWTDISKAVPDGGFLRGKKYVVIIGIDQNEKYFSTVTNSTTGKTWMDRNLGATQVATASNDYLAYGDLYQWGRLTDEHQFRNSAVTVSPFPLSGTDIPGHANFILAPNTPFDWRSGQNVNLWQGILTGNNNPCPSGFRIPTEAELETERLSWGSNNAVGAFASPLKFAIAGYRDSFDGSLKEVGTFGLYWSSTVEGATSLRLLFHSSAANMSSLNRAVGLSVRCIKDYV